MEPSIKFQVLRVPANGSSSELIEFDVHLFHTHKIAMKNEQPNLWHIVDEEDFRAQLKTPHHKAYGERKFFMFKSGCETEMHLPKNKTFEHVKFAHVYGDAFLFFLPKVVDEEGRDFVFKVSRYLDQEGTMLYAATDLKEFAQSFEKKGEAYDKAVRLAPAF